MPTSIGPQRREDELECAQCGAYFFRQLTRCPECGVNIFEPEDDKYDQADEPPPRDGLMVKIGDALRRLFGKSDRAEALFTEALDSADLYEELLGKAGVDRAIADRLIDFERGKMPNGTRAQWTKRAIQRWERDNRIIARRGD